MAHQIPEEPGTGKAQSANPQTTSHDRNQSHLASNSPRSAPMKTQKASTQPVSAGAKDLSSLRLPANYGATLGVKKLLTGVSVGKPKKHLFFRTHLSDDMTFAAMLLEQKEVRESYVVRPDVAQQISDLVSAVMLHAAVDRQNNVFLIPVPLPGDSGSRNPWHESLAQAVEHAKLKWIRIAANMHTGGYDVYEAEGGLPEPDWSDHDIDALVDVAFRGKIITSLDHPVIQALLGKV